jgi:hypothetical protein
MPAKKTTKKVKKVTEAQTKVAPVKTTGRTGRFTWGTVVETITKPFSLKDWSAQALDRNKVK